MQYRPGDVIYALNGRSIGGGAHLRTLAAALEPSAPTVLLVERDGTLQYLAFRIEK